MRKNKGQKLNKLQKHHTIQNQYRDFVTYFIRQCSKRVRCQKSLGPVQSAIKKAIQQLSKANRTKKNLQILLQGNEQELRKLLEQLKIQVQVFQEHLLQNAQLKIRQMLYYTYCENQNQIWNSYPKDAGQEIKIFVFWAFKIKKLLWNETGKKRFDMKKIKIECEQYKSILESSLQTMEDRASKIYQPRMQDQIESDILEWSRNSQTFGNQDLNFFQTRFDHNICFRCFSSNGQSVIFEQENLNQQQKNSLNLDESFLFETAWLTQLKFDSIDNQSLQN